MMKTIIWFVVLCLPLVVQGQNNQSAINIFLDPITFKDDRGKSITLYAISGLEADQTAYKRIITNGIANFSKRKKSYERVLQRLAFQEDFATVDALDSLKISGQFSQDELYNYLQRMVKSTGTGKEFLGFMSTLSEVSNLKYAKASGYTTQLFNKLKSMGRGIRKVNSHYGHALSAVNVVLEGASLSNDLRETLSTFVLMRSLQVDIALQRLALLRSISSNAFADDAFWEALQTVEEDLKNLPFDTWKQIARTAVLRKSELINALQSSTKIGVELYNLYSGAKLLSPWVGALIFTGKTVWLIAEWNRDFRDATCTATIYNALRRSIKQNNIKMTPLLQNTLDYAQFSYFRLQISTLDNAYLNFWAWILPKRSEPKQLLQNAQKRFVDNLYRRRAKNIFQQITPKNQSSAIGLIIDSSGSMSDNDPGNIRISAAKMILDRINPNTKIFVIDFDTRATWLNPTNWNNWKKSPLYHAVETIDSEGGTDIGIGIKKMQKALTSSRATSGQIGVLLLTDGAGDYNGQADWFAQYHIPIYTVSFVGQANEVLLKKIAYSTNGEYMKARTARDIVAAFSRFLTRISGANTILLERGKIHQGQSLSYSFFVEAGMPFYNVSTSWQGSNIATTLVDPDGNQYSPSNGNGQWSVGNNYSLVKVTHPVAGQWRADLVGVEIPPAGEQFLFEVSGKTRLNIELKERTAPGGLLSFQILSPKQQKMIKELKPDIRVTTPGNQELNITGEYHSGQFTFFPTAGKGTYQLDLVLSGVKRNGEPFQRHLSRSILVGEESISNVGTVTQVTGSYLKASLGKNVGNRPGVRVYVFSAGKSTQNKIAQGYVTYVTNVDCTIELQQFFGNQNVKVGDIVQLDTIQWQNDTP